MPWAPVTSPPLLPAPFPREIRDMALGSLLPELSEGASRTPLIELVSRWAAEKPDAPAFTYVDYSADPKGVKTSASWGEMYRRARAMAARLRQTAEPGDRAVLLLPQT